MALPRVCSLCAPARRAWTSHVRCLVHRGGSESQGPRSRFSVFLCSSPRARPPCFSSIAPTPRWQPLLLPPWGGSSPPCPWASWSGDGGTWTAPLSPPLAWCAWGCGKSAFTNVSGTTAGPGFVTSTATVILASLSVFVFLKLSCWSPAS